MGCLFCNDLDRNYKTEDGKDFVCSQCSQILISADQEDLNRAYEKAIEKGYLSKARAIESFLLPQEVLNDRETKKFKRNMVRKRFMRASRSTHHKIRA